MVVVGVFPRKSRGAPAIEQLSGPRDQVRNRVGTGAPSTPAPSCPMDFPCPLALIAIAPQDTADSRPEGHEVGWNKKGRKKQQPPRGTCAHAASSSRCGLTLQLGAKKATCLYVPKRSHSNLQSLQPSLQASEGFLDQTITPSTNVIVLI